MTTPTRSQKVENAFSRSIKVPERDEKHAEML
jgi:hypothetical protein